MDAATSAVVKTVLTHAPFTIAATAVNHILNGQRFDGGVKKRQVGQDVGAEEVRVDDDEGRDADGRTEVGKAAVMTQPAELFRQG